MKIADIIMNETTVPVVYHSTNTSFDRFQPGKPIFFSDNADFARAWGTRIIAARLHLANPLRIHNEGMHHEMLNDPAEIAEFRRSGHDGVIITNDGKATIYVVFDPSQIDVVG